MKSNDSKIKPNQSKKRNLFLFIVFLLVTLFLASFSATTFILINSYRLTYVGENLVVLQQEIGNLKDEISRKEIEIEELKLQLANIEGESPFMNNHPFNSPR